MPMPDARESLTVRAKSRTYFIDIRETSANKSFLLITESQFKGEDKEYERQTIAVFPEFAGAFLEAVTEMIEKLEPASEPPTNG